MWAILARIAAVLTSSLGIDLATRGASWVAQKTFLLFLFTVVLPIILSNALLSIYQNIMTVVGNNTGGVTAQNASLTGCLGYLAYKMRAPEAFTLILNGLAFRVVVALLPFVRL